MDEEIVYFTSYLDL